MSQESREVHEAQDSKNTTYELFIAALSVLSIINLILIIVIRDPVLDEVVGIMDGFLSVIFLSDFLYRFFTAESKSRYFLRQFGWADLLASFPFPQVKILRVFRIIRAGRLMRRYGAKHMIQEFLGNRASSALLTLAFLIILVLEFGGLLMLRVESQSPNANIKTASDAIWYIYVTITTVGYGDRYPVTNLGRVMGILIMTAGVGLFGTLTGFLANTFLAPKKEKTESSTDANTNDPKAKLAELKKMLDEQKTAQANVEAKIAEIEKLF